MATSSDRHGPVCPYCERALVVKRRGIAVDMSTGPGATPARHYADLLECPRCGIQRLRFVEPPERGRGSSSSVR